MISKNDWLQFFPHKTPRTEQENAIDEILNGFENENKKYIIAELPTGLGKSAIAITVAKFYEHKYKTNIITTQIILQEQYVKDFPFLANIHSKGKYTCVNSTNGWSCELNLIMQKAAKNMKKNSLFEESAYESSCIYHKNKARYENANYNLTNLHYFLSAPHMEKRDIVIIDECHNIENIITDIRSLTINRHSIEEVLKLTWRNFEAMSMEQFKKWVESEYLLKLQTELQNINALIDNATDMKTLGTHTLKKVNELTLKIDAANFFVANFSADNWVSSTSPNGDLFTVKPLHANMLNKAYLFNRGDKFLMMSGTILDKQTFCTTNGIPENETKFFSAGSPFKVENRQVIFIPVGSMSKVNIEKTAPTMLDVIQKLMDMHPTEKGIIHAWSYPLANRIYNNIDNPRLLLHTTDDRIETLNIHLKTDEPTVLISPSFTEGVDLKGDASRFQILAKVMYPYMGDNYVKTKMNTVKNWYAWQTIKNMIQASGRSVRDYDDTAVTYILDSDFENLLNRNRQLFPKWWLDSLIFYNN